MVNRQSGKYSRRKISGRDGMASQPCDPQGNKLTHSPTLFTIEGGMAWLLSHAIPRVRHSPPKEDHHSLWTRWEGLLASRLRHPQGAALTTQQGARFVPAI
jgi:hypothetical protein